MQRLIFTLTPKTAFATPLAGDTLFGQCCWAIRHLFSEEKLTQLLAGYLENKPFMVISDAMPQGFLPRPTLPTELLGFGISDTKQRKEQKAKKWFPESVLTLPLNQWEQAALTEKELMSDILKTPEDKLKKADFQHYLSYPQDHNSLNRLTGTTGTGDGFAPFQRQTFWYHPEIKLSLVIELDVQRLSIERLTDVLNWIGLHGYGKEASCGLGKFEIELSERSVLQTVVNPNAWLTLAACAPQGLKIWNSKHCYYETFTRFGRHGDMAVHQGSPFKNPILMAAPFAVLTPNEMTEQRFTGQGLGGEGSDGLGVISKTIKETVHQGYAPVLPVFLEVKNG